MNFNKFQTSIRKQLDQGRRAYFSLVVKADKLELPIDIQCYIFDILEFPILKYGDSTSGHI